MPAKSKAQQKFFGMVSAGKIKKPEGMSMKEVKKFARTKRKDLPEKISEGASLNQLLEGMTLKQYLIAEAAAVPSSPAVNYLRTLPQYQDMIKDLLQKPRALALMARLRAEFGDAPLSGDEMGYIEDEINDISQKGAMMGDWEGEADYERREQEDKDIASAVGKWEKATGMDAETGADIAPTRGQKSGAARRGVARGQTAATVARAKAEMGGAQEPEMPPISEVPPEEKGERVAIAQQKIEQEKAKMQGRNAASGAYERKVSSNGTVYYVKKREAMTDDDRAKERARNAAWRAKKRGVEQEEEFDDVEYAMQNDDDYYDNEGNFNPRGAYDAGGHYHADRDEQPDQDDWENEEDSEHPLVTQALNSEYGNALSAAWDEGHALKAARILRKFSKDEGQVEQALVSMGLMSEEECEYTM